MGECMVYSERAETAAVLCDTSHVTTKQRCKYATSVIFGGRGRETERETERDTDTETQTDRQRQTDRQTELVIRLESHTRRAR